MCNVRTVHLIKVLPLLESETSVKELFTSVLKFTNHAFASHLMFNVNSTVCLNFPHFPH